MTTQNHHSIFIAGSVICCLLQQFICSAAWAADLERINVSTAGVQGQNSDNTSFEQVLDRSGRYVAYWSAADTLVPGDTNNAYDVFVRDRQLGTTELASRSSGGQIGDGPSGFAGQIGLGGIDISADGRYVVFESAATNLVAGDGNNHIDVFIRDRTQQTTERIGAGDSHDSIDPLISDDGRYVVYSAGGSYHLYDRIAGTTSTFLDVDGENNLTDISGDGRYVVFYSLNNFSAADTNEVIDTYLFDRVSGSTELISVNSSGEVGNQLSARGRITPDGRYVAFRSRATNLVSGDTNEEEDLFLRDRSLGTTELVHRSLQGEQGNGNVSVLFDISNDGRYLSFSSNASNLVPGDSNDSSDAFVKDLVTNEVHRLNLSPSGGEDNGGSGGTRLSGSGRVAVFSSSGDNLVTGDTNEEPDLFAARMPFYPYEYAAKFICGVQPDGENQSLARGRYATSVNVHNPNQSVQFFKKLALTHPPREQAPGKIHPIARHSLEYDQGLAIDCENVTRELFPDELPAGFIEGFVVVQSSNRLDVTAVYTTSALDSAGNVSDHSSIDVEVIRERDRGIDLEVVKTVEIAESVPFGDAYAFHFVLYSVSIHNNGDTEATNVRLYDQFTLSLENAIGLSVLWNQEPIELPPGSQIENLSASATNTSFEVNIGNLPANSNKLVRFWVISPIYVLGLPASASLLNSVSVTGEGVELVPENNAHSVETLLVP